MKKSKPAKASLVVTARKAARKQKRLQKKANRFQHYVNNKKNKKLNDKINAEVGKFVKRPNQSEDDDNVEPVAKKKKQQPTVQSIAERERKKEFEQTKKLKEEMAKKRRQQLLEANEEEEKMIKRLEKQLGLKKLKNKKNLFADDGLDYLLEICDKSSQQQIVAAEKHLAEIENESDFEADLATVTGKSSKKKEDTRKSKEKDNEESELEDDDLSLDEETADGDNDHTESDDGSSLEIDEFSDEAPRPEESKKNPGKMRQPVKLENKPKINTCKENIEHYSDDSSDTINEDDENDDEDKMQKENDTIDEKAEKPDVWEDIYGRKRDKEGNVIKEVKGTYVPPHLRNKDITDDQDFAQLKRQIKSVLNKVSGAKLVWACGALEAVYGARSRHACNSALLHAWGEAVLQRAPTPPRLLADHAALLAVLHANLGSEIGAHFLQSLVKRIDALLRTEPEPAVEDKTLDNHVSALAHLYAFKVCDSALMLGLLTRLVEGDGNGEGAGAGVSVSEKRVECALCALRAGGALLRRDAPHELKAFVLSAQRTLAGAPHHDRSRAKFLADVLLAVKNNNLAKIPQYDPTYLAEVGKMAAAAVRRGNYVATLHISMQDLLAAEERGKWWVVGSAWQGAGAVAGAGGEGGAAAGGRVQGATAPGAEGALLELARQQRMNTDVRRTIFCTIMAAEDYMDAFEKLQQAGLRGGQQREIAHVLLSCSLAERTYNPYYGALASHLARHSRTNQLSLQFALWDRIKALGGAGGGGAGGAGARELSSLAGLVTQLCMDDALPISVLKIIEFSDLNKRTVRFMRQILLAILMNEDLDVTSRVFQRISVGAKLRMFRESLRLFIQHFVARGAKEARGAGGDLLTQEELARLQARVEHVDKILTSHDSKLAL